MNIENRLLEVVELIAERVGETNAKLGKLEAGLGSRIDQTNARLSGVETTLGAKIEQTNARLGTLEAAFNESTAVLGQINSGLAETNIRLGRVESRVGGCERGLDHVNGQLDSLRQVLTNDYQSLTVRADAADKRIGTLELRVDKLEDSSMC